MFECLTWEPLGDDSFGLASESFEIFSAKLWIKGCKEVEKKYLHMYSNKCMSLFTNTNILAIVLKLDFVRVCVFICKKNQNQQEKHDKTGRL